MMALSCFDMAGETLFLEQRTSPREVHEKGVTTTLVSKDYSIMFEEATSEIEFAPDDYYLFPPHYQQETDQWCWAGVAQSIMAFNGKSNAQCVQANKLFGQSTCCASPSSAPCRKGADENQISTNYQNFSFSSSRTAGALSFESVVAETYNSGRPLEAGIYWLKNGSVVGGHVVAIGGYSSSERLLYFMDPWYGDDYQQSYDSFKSSATQRWAFSWTVIRPI